MWNQEWGFTISHLISVPFNVERLVDVELRRKRVMRAHLRHAEQHSNDSNRDGELHSHD